MDTLIYGLYCANPNCCDPVIRYVGQTKHGIETRFNAHLNARAQTPVTTWIHEHGTRNIRYAVLEAGIPEEGLDERERYWIKVKGTFAGHGRGGVNSDKGGQGYPRDEEETEFSYAYSKENKSRKKLTWGDVREIRRLYRDTDIRVEDIARGYGIVPGTVLSIVMGNTWRDPDYRYVRRSRKGRNVETAGSAKLDWDAVREIRRQYIDGVTLDELARKFQVTPTSVSRIARNRSWTDEAYTPPTAWATNPYSNRRNCTLTMDQAEQVRQMFADGGVTRKQLGERFGVKPYVISGIVSGKTYIPDGKIQVVE